MSITHATAKGSGEVLYATEWNEEHDGIYLAEALDDDHSAIGTKIQGTAGENLVFGNVCYRKSDGKWWKTDADTSTTMPGMAMAIASITANNSGLLLLEGVARDDTWNWTAGKILFVHTDAGALIDSAPSGSGDQVQEVGIALDDDHVYFKPCPVIVEIV